MGMEGLDTGVVMVVSAMNSGFDRRDFAMMYRQWRRAYYNQFPTFWGTLPGENREEYAVYGALELSYEHARALRTASFRLYQLMVRLATVLQHAEDQPLIDMGIPLPAIPYR